MLSKTKRPARKRSGTTRKNASKSNNQNTPKKTKPAPSKENRITDYFPVVSKRLLAAKSKIEEYNNNIKYYIESCTDPKENLYIAEFDDKGKGIITSSLIRKGCFICEYSGDLVSLEEAKIRENEYESDGSGCYMYYFSWNSTIWCVDATKPTCRYGRLINHSRKAPNCKTKVFENNGLPHLIFIALRDIQPNEELLYDYGERDPHAIKSNPWLKST